MKIPVGWWIAFDPDPPGPFIGGSLEALDNAFSWAQEYDIKCNTLTFMLLLVPKTGWNTVQAEMDLQAGPLLQITFHSHCMLLNF